MIIRKSSLSIREIYPRIEYTKLKLKNLKPYFSFFLPLVENQTPITLSLIPLFIEYYEKFKAFYQQ